MAAGMIKAAVSIVLQGKNIDISWSSHFVGTLNLMAFLFLLSFVLAYSTSRTYGGLLVRQIMVKEKETNAFLRSLPS